MIDSKQLKYFLAIAEELHFHKAAQRLNITQPALSRQVRELERSMGAALFLRSSRRVELTAAGRELYGHGLRLLADMERATVSVQRVASGEFGTIVFAYPHSASHFLVPELLKHFHRTYPNVEVDLRGLMSQEQVDALRTGRIDVGLMRPGYEVPGVSSKLLVSESFVVAVPEGHPLAGRTQVPLRSFESDCFIMHSKQIPGISRTYDLIVRFFERAGFEPRVCRDSPDHMYLALGLVNAGVGVAVVPKSMARVSMRGVSFCELAEKTPPSEYALIWRVGDTDPRIELLAEFVVPVVA